MTNAREAADPVDRLCESVALGQADDPLAPITVVVPSPFARVQLRRAVGGRQGICNVGFRTWPELTNELGRAAAGPSGRVPTPRMVNEALRQVLSSTSSPLDSFARSPLARAELASVLYELWRAGPSLLSRLAEHGGRAESLVRTLGAVDAHLAKHGFVDPGRLLELAATAPLDPGVIGAVVLWYPRPARARDQAVLDHLVHSGVPLTTIAATADRPGSVELVIECSDPDEEVRVITRRLLGAVEAGMPLWRQAIIHPPLDRYRRIISQQLTAANVASSGPSPMMLAQSVTGRTLVGLLELAQGDWRRVDVVRWLGAAPITSGPGGTRVPVHRWDDISARAGVVAGLEQWRHRLDRFAGGGAKRDPHVAHDEPEIHSARALVEFVERLAAELGTPGTRWSEWSAWALRLLDLYLAPEDRTEEWGPAELAAARAVRHVLVELGGLDDVAPSTDLIAFRHAVEAELASNPVRDDTQIAWPGSEDDSDSDSDVLSDHVGLPGPVGTGVFVGTPTDARGLAFGRVYVVGLADQFLPGVTRQSSLIGESEIDDGQWPTGERRAAELLDDLRSVVGLAEGPAVVSWPFVDPRTGRENGRSRWLDQNGPLGAGWADETVPSFQADLNGPFATSVPLSAPDRLLGELARAVSLGGSVENHPAVAGDRSRGVRAPVPPLGESIEAARSPLVGGFSRFEGNVGPNRARGIADELSATGLEQYATCPRRYLLGRELKLDPRFRPEENEEMEARDRGTLVHEILATYVSERIGTDAPASLDRLMEIAQQRFSVAEDEGRCGPPLMARVERATLLRELGRFFEEDTLEPQAVELGFGRFGASADVADDRLVGSAELGVVGGHVGAVEVGLGPGRTVRFGGSVDRIDRGPNGSLVVSDYKTGRQRGLGDLRLDPVAAGTKLQLPIYALAAQAYLDWDGPIHARYWLLSWDRDRDSYFCTIDDRLLGRLREIVSDIVAGIEAGAFPAVPGDETFRPSGPTFKNCRYCDFDRLCPSDRDRRWSIVREAGETVPIVALSQPPGDELRDLVQTQAVNLMGDR